MMWCQFYISVKIEMVYVDLCAVKVTASWPFSQWKPCCQRCVEGKLWTNCAVSTFLCTWLSYIHTWHIWVILTSPMLSYLRFIMSNCFWNSGHVQFYKTTTRRCSRATFTEDVESDSRHICPLRYFFTDLRLKRTHDVCQVRSVSPGGAEAAHSRVRGSFLWLHGALCADVLPSSGTSSIPSIPKREFVFSDMSTFVFASRRRSCWTRSWTCWWQILPLNASCGCLSCTDLPT